MKLSQNTNEFCPLCGGELLKKEVQKLLKGGNDTAIVKVQAEICLRCGERLYSSATVRQFEAIRKQLKDRLKNLP